MNILLVEDNEGDILLTVETLEESSVDHHVTVIKDGAAAILHFEQANDELIIPDLVLLDINLPKKSGHEVLSYLKKHRRFSKMPVILLTTSSSERDMLLAHQNFADAFISKPLDINVFNEVINQIKNCAL